MTSSLLPQQPPPAARESREEASEEQVLALATDALKTRRLGEVAELEIAIQWAVIHGCGVTGIRWSPPAGDGTPSVRDHAIPELAMARESHPAPTRALIADGLDLAHRLP